MKQDNTVFVLQKAIHYFNISVTKETIEKSLKSHPNYPTFKSICDCLSDWHIDYCPLKIDSTELMDIETPYIAHLKDSGGQLAFVTKIHRGSVYYHESLKKRSILNISEFMEKCSGAAILIESSEKSGENDYSIKRQKEILDNLILPIQILAVTLFALFMFWESFSYGGLFQFTRLHLLFLTKILGIIFSVFLIFHEFDFHTSIGDKLCNINKVTNCNTVLNANAAKIFGYLGWSDLGFLYFLGGFLAILHNQGLHEEYRILAIMSALALPYPIFSIYYQGFVLKKWCPLCLGVQMLLIIEFIILRPQFTNLDISIEGISRFIILFIILSAVYLLANLYYREKKSSEMLQHKYLRFVKNPKIFTTLLFDSPHFIIPETNHSLVFGSKNATIFITAFLSLRCSHCSRAFLKLKSLLEENDNIRVNIVLLVSDENTINTLYYLNRQNDANEAIEFLEYWYNEYPYSKTSIIEKYCIPDDYSVIEEVRNENYNLYRYCNIKATPSFFVNGYHLPEQYDIEDIVRLL